MNTNRRTFLLASGMTALAANRATAASERIRVGAIGCGGRMRNLIDAADQAGGYDLVAACDVYAPNLDRIRERSLDVASAHVDYHELLDKKDIDAVIIAVPDHSHVRIATDALAAGKDVYLEKPVTHLLEEGEPLTRAVHRSNRILQCGMQQRSWTHFQSAVDLLQGGSIGRITQVRTYWFQNYQMDGPELPIEVGRLDWKRWLGSAPDQPFSEEKFRRWRWFWDFGGGAMTDLFTHWIDVVQWGMKTADLQLAQAFGNKYFFAQWQCPDTLEAAFRYPGFQVGYDGTMISSVDDGGLEFRGTKGTLKLTRGGFGIYREGVRGEAAILSEKSTGDGTVSHMENFFACIRDRKQPNAPVEAGVAAARAGHIGNQALRGDGVVNIARTA